MACRRRSPDRVARRASSMSVRRPAKRSVMSPLPRNRHRSCRDDIRDMIHRQSDEVYRNGPARAGRRLPPHHVPGVMTEPARSRNPTRHRYLPTDKAHHGGCDPARDCPSRRRLADAMPLRSPRRGHQRRESSIPLVAVPGDISARWLDAIPPSGFAPVRPHDGIARRRTTTPVRRRAPAWSPTLCPEWLFPTASLQTATLHAKRRSVREAFACQLLPAAPVQPLY